MNSLDKVKKSLATGLLALTVISSLAIATPNTNTSVDVGTDAEPKARMGSQVVATDQSNTDANLALTKAIRQRLVEDESLSSAAQNLQVITTEDGMVHIKGNVASSTEKTKIEKIVKELKAVEGRTLDFQLVVDENL